MASPTPNPIRKTIACAVVAFVAIYAGLWLDFRPTVRSGAHRGYGIRSLVVTPAIIVSLWARKSAKTWSLFRLIALYVLFLVISAALFISGSINNPQH